MATPGSVSRLDTAGVLRLGADPRTALEKQVSKTLLLSAGAPVAPGLPVSCVLSFLCGRFFCCAGIVLFSWFPSVGADPKTEHFRRQPPSTYAVTEYVATNIGGNAWMLIVLCAVQFLSAFSLSSNIASADWAFHHPPQEWIRYYSLCSSVFPVPSARRGITSCSRLSPNARPRSRTLYEFARRCS